MDAPSPQDTARARELAAGMAEMRKLTMAIGLPLPRALIAHMIERADAPAAAKAAWAADLEARVTELVGDAGALGSISFELGNQALYAVLGPCGADHDFGRELARLYGAAGIGATDNSQEGATIRDHLSKLVQLGKRTHVALVQEWVELVKPVVDRLPDGFNPMALVTDPANTTLYLEGLPGVRVGVFVRTPPRD